MAAEEIKKNVTEAVKKAEVKVETKAAEVKTEVKEKAAEVKTLQNMYKES